MLRRAAARDGGSQPVDGSLDRVYGRLMRRAVRVLMSVGLVVGTLSVAGVIAGGRAGATTVPTLTGVVDGQTISGVSGIFIEKDLTAGGEIYFVAENSVIHLKRLVAGADDCAGPAAVCELFSVSGPPWQLVLTPVAFLDFAPRPPLLIPQTAFVNPGTSGTTPLSLPILLSYASTQTVTVQWRTVVVPGAIINQAVPGADYIATGGTLTFPPGSQQENAVVSVIGRARSPADYTFVLQSGNPTNATMGGFWGLGFASITAHGAGPPP